MPDNHEKTDKVIIGKALVFDCSTKQLLNKQQIIKLNRAEREVLYTLIANAPRMVTKAELLKAGWVRKEVTPTSLFQTIRNLRIKLKEEEKGQIIELVPKLGYKINIMQPSKPAPSDDKPHKTINKSRRASKIALCFVLTLFVGLSILLYNHLQKVQFYHRTITDDDNNTVVLLSKLESDLIPLHGYSNQYITPKSIHDKLFFISKSDEYYSIAFCNKTKQNYCDPDSARAVTFKHFDIDTFWPLLTEESMTIGAMSVYENKTNMQASAKSYNLYLENGNIYPNLSQYFVRKKGKDTWKFTGISFRMNKDKSEFVAISFKGGQFSLIESNISPFIATSKITPGYFYWINSQEELKKMGVKLPGEVKNYENSLYTKAVGYDTYMLYRQKGLFLWYSPDVGFYWYAQQGETDSNFDEYFQFAKCHGDLQLNPDPECE
ncbi:winged helix-turn-helix domain-containing protein [Photobacterium kasasachensis]|uniref:winged helix-turn-helix domain-containing protein n=1 Tax=Photobacterium kasasachensis TaxID=2910240 RepID=UPI003D0FF436